MRKAIDQIFDCASIAVTTASDVQAVFGQASDQNLPVYVYRSPKVKGILLDFSNFNKIINIDSANLVATVEPGVTLQQLGSALAQEGLRFIPGDTPYYRHLTVGELIYRGTPNISSWKYGPGKFFLMGGDFVLPTGELMSTGGKTVKNVSGYDFTRLFTGAYADLAVGVRYLLKLLPEPEARSCLQARFTSIEQMLNFTNLLRQRPGAPSYLLWGDQIVWARLATHASGQQFILELDGVKEEVDSFAARVQSLINECEGFVSADCEETANQKANYCRLYEEQAGFVLIDEYKIPYSRQQEFLNLSYRLFGERKVAGGWFGHLAEGKLNLYLPCSDHPPWAEISELAELVHKVGGAFTGKYQRLYEQVDDTQLARLESSLKRQFDPNCLLNR